MKVLGASLLAMAALSSVAGTLTPALQREAASNPNGFSKVVILLRNQPGHMVSREVAEIYEPEIRRLGARIREIHKSLRMAGPIAPALERRTAPELPIDAAAERDELLTRIDEYQTAQANETARMVQMLVASDLSATDAFIRSQGGQPTGVTTAVTAMFATVPNQLVRKIAAYSRIAWLDLDVEGSAELDMQKTSLGLVTGFWGNSFTGGPLDVGVLDTGVYQAHPAFNGHRFESNAGVTDPDGHGTGIAGIMASTNATYTGMVFGCDTICVATAGGNSTSMTGMNYLVTATTEKPENVNYSFGNGRANDIDYSPFDAFFDGTIDTFNIMVSKSTGNNGFGTTTITHPAPAYNLLASANMDDLDTAARTDDVITSDSSRGPTLGGRKKPDITAPGTDTMTTNRTGSFSNLGGTSSASPHTGGGIVLARQLGATTTYGAKAVLLNAADAWTDGNTQSTSDDGPVAGSLWNKTFGWGYLDLGEAFANGSDLFENDMPAPGAGERKFKLFKGHMFAGEKATLVWNKHVLFNGAQSPTQIEDLSNLDLVVYNRQTNQAVGTSNSTIDNVEQVDVDADGPVVLKVYATSPFDPQIATEGYGLATEEGFEESDGITFAITPTLPPHALPGTRVQVSVQVTNTSILPAYDVDVSIAGAAIVNGANPTNFTLIQPGQSRTVVWDITAQSNVGQQPLTFTANSDSYGETFSGSVLRNLNVANVITHPTGHSLVRGNVAGGSFADVLSSNDVYFSFRPGVVFSSGDKPVVIEFVGVSHTTDPSSLSFVIESAGSSSNLRQTIEMYDFGASSWVEVDARNVTTIDGIVTVSAPAPLPRFISLSQGVSVRVSMKAVGATFSYPWIYRIDEAGWLISG
jgi:serine protease AprX